MQRKKRIKSLILSILMLLTYTLQPLMGLEVQAKEKEKELPQPYKYWGIAISAVVDISNGGTMQNIIEGRNLKDIEGIPTNNIYGKDLNARLVTDISVPKEYVIDGVDSIMAFDDYRTGSYPKTENKDSDWKKDKSLIWITHMDAEDGKAAGLPFTMNRPLGDGKSFDITIHVPDKEYMLKTDYTDRSGTTDGTNRKYNTTLSFVLVAHHEKFNPETGEWDIESKVSADLKMNEESPAKWNYKDFDENTETEYSVNMDASGSSSARPDVTYTYDMGLKEADGNVDYKNEKTSDKNEIILNGDISPTEIYDNDYKGKKSATGTFRVDGTVEVKDDKDVSDTAYANTKVGFEIVNEKPTAIYKATDKATSSDKYLYAKRTILIKDQSLDPEDNLMDSDFSLFDGTKKIASWTFKKDKVDGIWNLTSSSKLDEYIEDMSLNASTLENTLTFKKTGAYRLEQTVGDIRGHEIVDKKFDTRNSILNIRSAAAPPVANFEYRLNGKVTDYTYPNVEVSLLDKSTDENDDIVKWEWTKHNDTKHDGQNGATAVFPSEGTYNNTLKVTDFLGLSDSITKPIQVLPPIPKAEITTNDDESLMKKNRRIIISSEESFAPPSDPIQWDKTKWSIVPMNGQNPSSIKISSSLSDSKKKAVVFKQTGKYKVTIDLENNYTQANPNHPRINLKTTSIIIEIKDDIKPEPKFEITGNAPNFKDNPISTVAKVANTSESKDNDFLDVFPELNLDDPNNYYGRGKNAFEMEIRKDINEDGTFSDDEIYGNYSGRSVDIPVKFKEGEGTDYEARLKIKETFGQPTITEFVTENDRVTNSLIKKFSINWIPDIKFDLPDWAYPDDKLEFKTNIKDEKPDKTIVVWSVQKKDASGTYKNIDIDKATKNNLTRDGGDIQFKESGFYILKADITDEKGQKSSFQDEIRIYPFPTAVLSDDFRFDNTDSPKAFNAKQNRKYLLTGNNSHINDPYGTGIHDIDHSKDYYEVIPLHSQPLDTIKVTDGVGGLLTLKSEDDNIFKATNKKLDTDMLFNLPGEYKVRYQVTNKHGKKSEMIEQVIKVHEDKIPEVQFEIIKNNYRDPEDSNQAKLLAYDIKIYSPDRDNILIERVRYRFDSNNNKSFDDEVWQNAGVIDKKDSKNWKVEVKKTHVGKYEFEIYTEESYGQPTIDRFVDKNGIDKRTRTVSKLSEIDNQPPLADFGIIKKHKVDILFAIGQTKPDNTKELNAKINTYIKSFLNANGGDVIDTSISMIESSAIDTNTQFPWVSYNLYNSGMGTGDGQFSVTADSYVYRGYGAEAPIDHLYYDDKKQATREFTFDIDMDGYNSCATVIPGFIFGADDSNNKFKGYMALMWHDTVRVYKFDSTHAQFTTNGTGNISAMKTTGESAFGGTLLYTIPARTASLQKKFKFVYRGKILSIYEDNQLLQTVNCDNPEGTGFGVLASNSGHGCGTRSYTRFKNFQLESSNIKTLDEVLRTATWREGSTRFVVNIDDAKMSLGYDWNNVLKMDSYLKILSLLSKDNIYYVGLGTSENENENNQLIHDNNAKGASFYNNSPNIDKALSDTGQYILNIIKSLPAGSTKYLLLNELIKYKTIYTDYENDPKYNIDNWKYTHNENYFENSLGRHSLHNQWLTDGIDSFDKVGSYVVEYKTKDNPVGNDDRFDIYRKWSSMPNGPMTLYVHRKPIANASFKISKSGASMNVSLKSLGYDLDHISMANKGIIQKEWFYREVGSSTWINGGTGETLNFTGNTTKNYIVKHRVRDIDGEDGIGVWSDDNIILITSSPLPPVANFEVNPIVYPLGTSLLVKDFSYDPNGDNIVEYRWEVSKENTTYLMPTLTNSSGVTQNQVDTVAAAVKAKIDSLGHNAYGDWLLELQVRDNTGNWGDPLSTSDKVSKVIKVVPNNLPPAVNIEPTHVFVDGKNPIDIDNISSPLNNFINWNLSVSDPNADNKGFVYRWELEHHEGEKGILKNTSEISSKDKLTTKVYNSKYPFTNQSFENNNLPAGPYKVRLQVTDIPAYGEAKSVSTEKNLYIVPKINAIPYVISDKDEILCGDTVTLRVITDKVTTGISAEVLGQTIELSEVRKNGEQYIWESPFLIPKIKDSSNIDIDFTVKTNYGSKDIFGNDNQTTRIKRLKETIYVTALKLEDFRVTDLVKHSQYKDLYPLRRADFTLDYITGYYCTFNIDAKGNPERVFASVSHNNTEITTLELKKIGSNGTVGIWEGKYFAPYNTPKGTIISFNLEASKGTTKYNYNDKESWDGATLEVKDTLLKDAAISRTN